MRPNAFIVRVHVSRRLVHDGAARVVALIDVKLGSFSQRERGLFVKGDALSDCLRQASEDVDPMGPSREAYDSTARDVRAAWTDADVVS
ncbi:MAG: hypothetical protein P8L45_11880 [Longimicrobiales bacterium]|nr:hypothetical protein [Longimicrobiales bacterium]